MSQIWLCLRLPRLPLEALHVSAANPAAVYERKRSRKQVVCLNAAAETFGLAAGIDLGAATTLTPGLKIFERNPRAERAALAALCALAYRIGSPVTAQPHAPQPRMHALWVEIGASLTLFGGIETLAGKFRESLHPLHYTFALGIAPTLEGAYLLAGREPVLDRSALWHALGLLPLTELPVAADSLAAMAGSGLTTLGEVLALPLDALARRFSPDFTDYLGRMVGRLPDARRFYSLPPRYRRNLELPDEIETTEALRFPIKRLLSEFAGYLAARDTGVQRFTLGLEHEGGSATPLEIGLASPGRDAVHFQVLVQTRLEHLSIPAPVRGLVLSANEFAPVRIRQFDLFAARSNIEEEWQAVVDRLRARLGASAVQGLGLHADHRPEKSWVTVPCGTVSENTWHAERPLWLLPEPRELAVAPHCIRGPERIEGGWWDGNDVQRDYYVSQTSEGSKLWVYREHLSGRWFLHGLWA